MRNLIIIGMVVALLIAGCGSGDAVEEMTGRQQEVIPEPVSGIQADQEILERYPDSLGNALEQLELIE